MSDRFGSPGDSDLCACGWVTTDCMASDGRCLLAEKTEQSQRTPNHPLYRPSPTEEA